VLWKTPKAQVKKHVGIDFFGSIANVKFMLTLQNSKLSLFSASLENFPL
jgi:hypothetical protein